MGIYRSRLEIIADILQVVDLTAKKTQIMFQANLSYQVLQKYLAEVTNACLVNFEQERQCYLLTDKGRGFLNTYNQYCVNNKRIEERLNDINNTKKVLEELCKSNNAYQS